MPRILLLIVLGCLLFKLIKRLSANVNDNNPPKKTAENMLQCAKCGCHVPESECKQMNPVICNNPECQT
jgi:hypothetical protein